MITYSWVCLNHDCIEDKDHLESYLAMPDKVSMPYFTVQSPATLPKAKCPKCKQHAELRGDSVERLEVAEPRMMYKSY